jgi:hypothetical protein
MNSIFINRGVVEEVLKKNGYLQDFLQHLWCCNINLPFTMDVTMDIGLQSFWL